MANKLMFQSVSRTHNLPIADTTNNAGGKAYSFSPEHALAQYAVTGVFQNTYYSKAEIQLDKVLMMLRQIKDVSFIGKVAVYARHHGNMKDVPAFLVAYLASQPHAGEVFKKVFPLVINDGRMLRNFVQFIRSGVVGRKCLGSMSKKMVAKWFDRDADKIFCNSIGNEPSLADVIKLSHPRPASATHDALFGYLLGKTDRKNMNANLPDCVKAYEAFKADPHNAEVPNIPFQFIASLDIPDTVWSEIAKDCSWQTLRMNLNTFERHGVMKDKEMVNLIANRLCNKDEVLASKVFPYQLFTAYKYYNGESKKIKNALEDAMEISLVNIPDLGENVIICPDVSGSMSSPVTGDRYGATSAVRCIDVAAVVASSILRKNPNAEVLPFAESVVNLTISGKDSVMTNANRLAGIGGGGTNCGAPLERIVLKSMPVDTIIFISDNESWMTSGGAFRNAGYFGRGATNGMNLWSKIKTNNPKAKMICIDIQPNDTTQFTESKDILNVGGFSDTVYNVMDLFVNSEGNLVEAIKTISF